MAKDEKAVDTVVDNIAEEKAAVVIETNEEKKVPYFIAYVPGEEKEVTVGVNGKMYKIQKGVDVMIPESVAEVLKHSNQQTIELECIKEEIREQDLSY